MDQTGIGEEAKAGMPTDDRRLHLVVSMGVYRPERPTYLDDVRLGQALMTFFTIARTTPGCVVHFIYTGVDNEYLALAARVLATGSAQLDPMFLSPDAIRGMLENTKMNPIGTHSMVRLVLPEVLQGVKDCIWLDCDVVVFDDLNKMASEAREALRGNGLMFAGSGESSGTSGIVNAGVLFLDLERMRKPGVKSRIISFCDRVTDESGSGLTLHMIDQDVVNALGVAHIDPRWNITLHNYGSWDPLPDDKGCLHFTGEKKYAWSPYSETPNYSFLKGFTAEMLKAVPEIPGKWVAIGTGDLSRSRGMPHRHGGPVVELNEPQPVIKDSNVESIDVAYGISGDEHMAKAFPVSAYSVVRNSSAPVKVHVAYLPGTVSDEALAGVEAFANRMSKAYGCVFDIRALSPEMADNISGLGGRSPGTLWDGHLVTCFLHDCFPDVDVCVKLDTDTLVVDDMPRLVKYCIDRGLGETKHMFGCRSKWRDSFCAEYNLGVAPESFRMIRESKFDAHMLTQLTYGRRVISDDVQTMLIRAGIIRCGSYPPGWNMVGAVRRNLSQRDVMEYQAYDVFYGKKHRVDGYEPVLCQQDYRRSTKVYHFTDRPKPWADDWMNSVDPDCGLWIKYKDSMNACLQEV